VRAHSAASGPDPSPPGVLSPDVRRILIVGAGGFGREVLEWTVAAWPSAQQKIAGFLSADLDDKLLPQLPIVADPDDFTPLPGDGLLLAIGIPDIRRRVAESLGARGANFLTLIHPTAIVAKSATIGTGSVLCPHAIVSDSASTGRCALLNYFSSVGHDASMGDFAVLSPYAALGGGSRLAEDGFLGMHAAIAPRRTVGRGSRVSANSVAMTDAAPFSLVYGVPGRVVPRIQLTVP